MNALLGDTLALAVPLEAQRLADLPIEDLRRWLAHRSLGPFQLDDDGMLVSGNQPEAHDEMLYGGPNAGSAFAGFARGLAVLSFAAGGVEFAGVRWTHIHPEGVL